MAANEFVHADPGSVLTQNEYIASPGSAGGHTLGTNQAVGDMIYASSAGASGIIRRLAIGTSGQYLTVAGGIPAWSSTLTGSVITATTNFTIGDTVITDGVITDSTGLSIAAVVNLGANAFTTTGLISGGSLDIDDVLINGATIGHTDDTDLMTVADGALTVAGTLTASGVITAGGLTIGSAVIVESELETIDDVTAGTVAASKAVVVDANLDIASFRNLTATGAITADSLDIDDGGVDINGTLEANAYTVAGTALDEFIQDTVGAMFTSNTETRISVTYDDSDGTIDLVVDNMNGTGEITDITSLYHASLKVGHSDSDANIDFSVDNTIFFDIDGSQQVKLVDGVLQPVGDSDVDLGTTGVRWKDAFVDSLTTTANVTVGGDLTVSGTTTTVNTETLSVEDSLIALASGNDSADLLDVGLYGLYDSTGDKYSGLFRDATDGKWKLFKDLTEAPTTTVNTGHASYAGATLVATLEGNADTVTTNADLAGDVTSSGNTTTIADDAVDIAHLSASGTPSSTTFLRGDNAWVEVSSKLDSPVITGTLTVNTGGAVTHTISNWSDDVSYTITPTNCTIGSVASNGEFVVTHTSGSPSYTIQATTDSLGLTSSEVVTKNVLIRLAAPGLNDLTVQNTDTNVDHVITSNDTNDDKLILDIGSSDFTYQSVSVGSGSKVGNTVEVTGFTTNNPTVTVQYTAEGTYSVTAKAVRVDGTYGDSDLSAVDTVPISDFDPTSPYDYGNGSDGAATEPWTVLETSVSDSPAASDTTCEVGNATGFSVGDKVLLIQSQRNAGLTEGTHEYLEIGGISGTTITFNTGLQNTYYYTTYTHTQMVRIPEYTSVTLSETFTVPAWDGSLGGIIVFKCQGTVTLTGKIDAEGKGFRGGDAASFGYGYSSDQGEGQTHVGSGYTASNNASGGAGGRGNVPGTLSSQSGAGGGHATAGEDGNTNATGGTTWGGQDLTDHLGFGGSGGSGGYDYGTAGGNGAHGGGIVVIMADEVTLSGSGAIDADGGLGDDNGLGNQGGGAGGSILIVAHDITTNSAITADGSAGGDNGNPGAGGDGRIHLKIVTSTTGGTSPTAYTG